MNKKLVLFVVFLFVNSINAQIHEFGVFVGGSNFVGDIGSTTYIAPNETAIGLLYKWNKSPRHSWRISFLKSSITAQDNKSDTAMRIERNLDFKNSIKEVSLGMEFNFFDFNLHESEIKIVPYIYTGLSVVSFYQMHYVNKKLMTDNYDYSFAIPMVLGVKTNITNHLILGLETGVRYTFTDNLDGNNPERPTYQIFKFGNTNSNDWITFTGLTVTYTFGQKPCYCN